MRRHAEACGGMLPAVGGGQPSFPKAAKVAKPRTKHKGMHVLTPCKDEHSSIMSWVVMLRLLLLTFPLFVHRIGIRDCQMVQRLITHIAAIMCQGVSQQTAGQSRQGANLSVLRHAAACFPRWCLLVTLFRSEPLRVPLSAPFLECWIP